MKNLKQKLVAAGVFAVSYVGFASAQTSDIESAMNAIKTDATTNVGIMLPIGIAVLGVIVGASITIAIFKRITGRVS